MTFESIIKAIMAALLAFTSSLSGCYKRGVAGPEVVVNDAYFSDLSVFDYASFHTDNLGFIDLAHAKNPTLKMGLVTPQKNYSASDMDRILGYGLEYWCWGNELTSVDVSKIKAWHDLVAGRTKTCVTFNYENMGTVDFTQLSFLSFIAFTTYPWMKYAKVSDIPSNYFSKMPEKFAITETAWPSVNYNGIVGSEDEQVNFAKRLSSDSKLTNAQYVSWFFLNDYNEVQLPFGKASLRNVDHTPKKVYQAWKVK
jgi:hypothetical protein